MTQKFWRVQTEGGSGHQQQMCGAARRRVLGKSAKEGRSLVWAGLSLGAEGPETLDFVSNSKELFLNPKRESGRSNTVNGTT